MNDFLKYALIIIAAILICIFTFVFLINYLESYGTVELIHTIYLALRCIAGLSVLITVIAQTFKAYKVRNVFLVMTMLFLCYSYVYKTIFLHDHVITG